MWLAITRPLDLGSPCVSWRTALALCRGISMIIYNNRNLRRRHGDILLRVRRAGGKGWRRGHALG
jgi:hypothetical protein